MTDIAPASMYRSQEGLGVWPHKGKVASVGIGHSPTMRRWDGTAENTVGGLAIQAIRKAIEDSGFPPEQFDGLVIDETTTTGSHWPEDRPLPEDFVAMFEQTSDPLDGIGQLSAEWILKNIPELKNVTFTMIGPGCMSNCVVVAAEAVGRGLTSTCLVVKGWQNFAGRYYQEGAAVEETRDGPGKYQAIWGGPACWGTAQQFQRYMVKYNKTHEMNAPFVVNSRRNGLLFPEGYWYQHRPEALTADDYNNARWIAKPANLYDNDIPIMAACCYVFTTADRARDAKQKPAYIWNVASNRFRARSTALTLEEVEESCAHTGRMILDGAGIKASDLSFEDMYDGFGLFHIFHIEGLGYAGIKRGEALDLYQGDISIEGPNPVSPSGGNIGSGRTRFWMHTDAMQQIQGRAGARQIHKAAEIGVSGGPTPTGGNFTVWSATPS